MGSTDKKALTLIIYIMFDEEEFTGEIERG